MAAELVTLALCGDVMLGRGIDQILPFPGDPTLREPHVRDARTYVALAERANGPIPVPVDPAWPWGDALAALDAAVPDARIVNLETSLTRCEAFAPGKRIHYRMNPDNLDAVTAARPDVCVLANNHVLDFGPDGLRETLDVLAGAGLATAGAGRGPREARLPAVVPLAGGGRILTFAVGLPSSGIPPWWAPRPGRPGVETLGTVTDATVGDVVERVQRVRRPGDVVVASLHWGSNWGHQITPEQRHLAHALVEGGIDVVHGHSSHHPRPVEIHRDRLVLYGCGDLVNDYEGIGGHERYRGDLRLLFVVSVHAGSGALARVRMVPLRARRLRLEHASADDARWLASTLDRTSRLLGTRIRRDGDGQLAAEPR